LLHLGSRRRGRNVYDRIDMRNNYDKGFNMGIIVGGCAIGAVALAILGVLFLY
jgi:hypothetical protein